MYKNLILLFLLFLALEILLRILFPIPELSNFNRILFQNPKIGESLPYLSNENLTWSSTPDTNHHFVHRLNEYGFRDKSWPLKKTKKRILVVGDSFVEGLMVENHQTIPSVFQNLIGEEAEVFNAGMNGVGFSSYLKLVKYVVPTFTPDEVYLLIYANDIAPFNIPDNIPYEPIKNSSYVPRMVYLIQKLKAKEKINSPFFKPTNPFLFPVPDQYNPFTANAYQLENQVSPLLKSAMIKGEANYHMINALEKKANSFASEFALDQALNYIQGVCKENNTKIKVFYLPDRNQITDEYISFEKASCLINCQGINSLLGDNFKKNLRKLKASCEKLRITFFDLSTYLQEIESTKDLYWSYDEHMKIEGYRYIADFLFQVYETK